MIVTYLLFIAAFSFINRCRGTRFYNKISSTSVGRILATGGMALATYLLAILVTKYSISLSLLIAAWTWASLYFWCVFAWDNYPC